MATKTAAPKAPKEQAAAPADPSKAILEAHLKENEADHFDFTTPVDYSVSSGSLKLDMEIGGFRPGAHRFAGPPNVGKTPFVLNVVDSFLDTVPNSKAIWCKSEGRLSPENLARMRHKVVYKTADWDIGTLYIHRGNVYEEWIGMIRRLITNNPTEIRFGFVTDSLDSMNLKNDTTKAIAEGNKVAGGALMTKQMFQKIGLAMTERGHMKLYVGQRTAEVQIDQRSHQPPRQVGGSGGNGLAHFANEALEFMDIYEGSLILKDPEAKMDSVKNPALGHWLKIKLKKASKEKRFVVVEIPIRYGQVGGNSIWREREIGDMLLAGQLVEKKGTWLAFTDVLVDELAKNNVTTAEPLPKQVQGINQLYALLEGRKDVTTYLFNRFRSMATGGTP